jgi:hypothetical protein
MIFAALAAASLAAASLGPLAAQPQPQPHMTAALAALQTAEAELARATHDKGGHRVKALQQVRAAIAQVRAGIKADNRR